MQKSLWVIDHVAGALAIVAIVSIASVITRGLPSAGGGSVGRFFRVAALVFCLGVLGWLGIETVGATWRVTGTNVNDPACVNVGLFARDHLPDNAVLLCEEWRGYEHLTTMFYADRTCYALRPIGADEMARQVLRAGGIPYIVSYQKLPLPPIFENGNRGPTVYLWQPR